MKHMLQHSARPSSSRCWNSVCSSCSLSFIRSLSEAKRLSATDNEKTKRQNLMQKHGTAPIYPNARAGSGEKHFVDAVAE